MFSFLSSRSHHQWQQQQSHLKWHVWCEWIQWLSGWLTCDMTKEQETDFCHLLQRERGERGTHSIPISHCIIHPETTSVDGFHHHRLRPHTSIPMHLQHTPNYNINHRCTARFSILELNSIHQVSTWTEEGLLLLLVSPNAPSATEDDHDVHTVHLLLLNSTPVATKALFLLHMWHCKWRTMNIELWSVESFKLAGHIKDWHQTLVSIHLTVLLKTRRHFDERWWIK